MNLYLTGDDEFIEHLSKIILDNLGNENFGVTEFIKATRLNRNYLSRRIKSIRKITINQFITEVRLEKAHELLLEGTHTAAEVSYNVGFNSPNYFNKCFHGHFGYPPGDIKKGTINLSENMVSEKDPENIPDNKTDSKKLSKLKNVKFISLTVAFFGLAVIILNFLLFNQNSPLKQKSIEKSIAILPFKNLSENEENRYFADGVVEDILDRLAKISELKVVSRTSVEQFRESAESAPEIGKKLGVNYLLEGSVQRHHEKVRITIQLIDAKNDRHILSEKIDRDLKDILELESDIAKLIADKLQAAISTEEKQLIEKAHTHNTEAYDYYLMGRFYWNIRSPESIAKSIGYFENAIHADSNYALAYAGLANAYYALTRYSPTPVKYYEKAIELAEKALQLDENLPEAYAVLGAVYSNGYWQWKESRKYFEKAMDIDSNNIVMLYYYSDLLHILGEFEASRRYIDHAIEIDPYSAINRIMSAYFYYQENKANEALKEVSLLESLLGNQSAHQGELFVCYLYAGDTLAALEYMKKGFETNPNYSEYQPYANQVIPIYKTHGLAGLYRMMYKTPPDYWYAVNMDSLNTAIYYLDEAYKSRSPRMARLVLDNQYVKLHNDPRFLEIVNKTGLTPYYNLRYKK
jgi:TolB-like protein/AraC-like DNA-binding protein/Tfp pilus assembly protein PilF